MLLKRFEKLSAYLHFNHNELMMCIDDSLHDVVFKIRPILDYFSDCYLHGMYATWQKLINKHNKLKGHNILIMSKEG